MVLANTGAYRPDPSSGAGPGGGEDKTDLRLRESRDNDAIDLKYGFERISDQVREETGYLLNMHSTEVLDEDRRLVAAVDYYFLQEDGARFKVSLPFQPYLYVLVRKEFLQETQAFLSKKYTGLIAKMELVDKEDLDLANHLVGLKQR